MQVNFDVAVLPTLGSKASILIDHVAQNFHINGSAFQEVPDVCDFRGKSVLCNHGLSEVLVRPICRWMAAAGWVQQKPGQGPFWSGPRQKETERGQHLFATGNVQGRV